MLSIDKIYNIVNEARVISEYDGTLSLSRWMLMEFLNLPENISETVWNSLRS